MGELWKQIKWITNFPLFRWGPLEPSSIPNQTRERAHFCSCLCHIPPVGCGRLLVAACSALCGSQSALHRDRSEKKTKNVECFSSWHQNYERRIKSQHFYLFYVASSSFVFCVAGARAAKKWRVNGVIAVLHIWTCFCLVIKFSISILLTN